MRVFRCSQNLKAVSIASSRFVVLYSGFYYLLYIDLWRLICAVLSACDLLCLTTYWIWQLILIGYDLTNMPDLWFALDSLIVVILTIGGQACLGMFSGSILFAVKNGTF
jgi:hypothetical protein